MFNPFAEPSLGNVHAETPARDPFQCEIDCDTVRIRTHAPRVETGSGIGGAFTTYSAKVWNDGWAVFQLGRLLPVCTCRAQEDAIEIVEAMTERNNQGG